MARRSCERCGKPIPAGEHHLRRFCSNSCKNMTSRDRRNGTPLKSVEAVNVGDWPSEFSATLSRLSVAQRSKLRRALEAEDRLRAQAGVPQTVDLSLIDLPAHELRARLGPTADLTPYGWTPGAALLSFIESVAESLRAPE